jgi:carbohydrate-binding DOMON domain-containing protein
LFVLLFAASLSAQTVSFTDPTGDDDGPGTYVYPTDRVYGRGSFDLTGFTLKNNGTKTEVTASVNATLADEWSTGVGFSTQMIFVFIDKDGKAGSGHVDGLPGLNIRFAPESAWEKVVVLSPLAPARVKAEVEQKAASVKGDVIVPARTRGAGRTISATFDAAALGEGDPTTWSYQVIVQSSEGFPSGSDLLTRKVNEYEGQHRFGGGHDDECDPHVLDLLAGSATGAKEEIALQHQMLSAYQCDEGTALAVVSNVRAK